MQRTMQRTIHRLLTALLFTGLASQAVAAVADVNAPELRAVYEGAVTNTADGRPLGILLVKVARNGSFSFLGRSIYGDGRGRGTTDAGGSFTGTRNIFGRNAVLNLTLNDAAGGNRPFIDVVVEDADANTLHTATLYQRLYTGSYRHTFAMPGRYTFSTGSGTDGLGAGEGAAIAFANISSRGRCHFIGYTPDNRRFRTTRYLTAMTDATLQDMPMCALFTRSRSRHGNVHVVGQLDFADLASSDATGTLRLHRNGVSHPVPFNIGYDEDRPVVGSYFQRPASFDMPVTFLSVGTANALVDLLGGLYDADGEIPVDLGTELPFIVTYDPRGKLRAPVNTEYRFNGTQYTKTGEIAAMAKTFYVPGKVQTQVPIRMAVLQKPDVIQGFYLDRTTGGFAEVRDNVAGDLPPNIVINPRTRSLNGNGGIYNILVDARNGDSQDWPLTTVSGIPIDGGGGTTATLDSFAVITTPGSAADGSLIGTGQDIVQVAVPPNSNDFSRRTEFLIGGVRHSLWQGPRIIQLIPGSLKVPVEGGSFPVDVITDGDWTVTVPADVDWVTVSEATGTGNGGTIVTVAENLNTLFDAEARTATILFGTKEFTITQDTPQAQVSPQSVNVPANQTRFTVDVTSTGAWTATPSVDWMRFVVRTEVLIIDDTVVPPVIRIEVVEAFEESASGDGDGTFEVQVNANSTGLPFDRAGFITVNNQIVEVRQSWKPSVEGFLGL